MRRGRQAHLSKREADGAEGKGADERYGHFLDSPLEEVSAQVRNGGCQTSLLHGAGRRALEPMQ